MLRVHPVPAFSDNYIWLLEAGGVDAYVVDPGDAQPVRAALAARGLRLAGILVTHHHPDHVGGLPDLCAGADVPVHGPLGSPARGITHPLADGDRLEVLGREAQVIAVPGHTLDHIAFFLAAAGDAPPLLFCGDTLFAGGCGRLFEGSAATMHASLGRLAALPPDTRVFCAHEYTLSNLRFARAVEPDNAALAGRMREDAARRERGEPTVPSMLGLEYLTNPFLRSAEPAVREAAERHAGRELPAPEAVFEVVRAWKDTFR